MAVLLNVVVVVVLVFNVPPTAKVIMEMEPRLKVSSDRLVICQESNLRLLVYKASGLSTTPHRLHECCCGSLLPLLCFGEGASSFKTIGVADLVFRTISFQRNWLSHLKTADRYIPDLVRQE